MDFFDVIHTQRSIRKFKPDAVPDEAIWAMIDAATRAPSGGNTQPWAFLVIKDPAKRKLIADAAGGSQSVEAALAEADKIADPVLRRMRRSSVTFRANVMQAPVLIVPCLVNPTSPSSDIESIWAGSSIYGAVQNLMLAARALGLGTVLTTYNMRIGDTIPKGFGVPEGALPVAVIPVGYPAEGQRFGPVTRRPAEDVTYWGPLGRYPEPELSYDNYEAAPVRFGLFDWVDSNDNLSIADVFEQRLRMLEYADQAGMYCYHIAEHHGTPLSVASAPNLLLAAASQRTENLRLGPLVQLLPLSNPLRNIEEVCMLDHLSRGRLELGVGRGISPGELAMYGLEPSESTARFEECFEMLLQGLTTGQVHHEGKYYKIHADNLPVRPMQTPCPPLWYPTSNVDRIPWVARHGFNTIFGFTMPTLEQTAEQMTRFRDLAAEHAGEEGRYNGHVAAPYYGVTRHIYVAESDEVAIDEARVAYTQFDQAFANRPGQARSGPSRRGDFPTALERGLIIAGSPETVRKNVQRFIEVTGANYFVGIFAYGHQTDAQVLRSLRLFAEEVIPAISPSTVGT